MYFITAIVSNSRPGLRINRRTFGYYPKLTEARCAVKMNLGSMHEYLYDYIVIERITPGIHALPSFETWYKWNDKKWMFCEKPFEFMGIINFALG